MCISTLCFKINFYVLEYFVSCFNLKTHPYFTRVLQKHRFSHKDFADIKNLKTTSPKYLTFMYVHRSLICHNETLLITFKGGDQKLLYANLNCYSVSPPPNEMLY
jgi:hypothetical protein